MTVPPREPDIEGRSKKVWIDADRVGCTVELKPTLDSFTYDRSETMPGTDELRLNFYEVAATKLATENEVSCVFDERLGPTTYRARYAPGPPFEVIVKNRAVGSTVRKYPGLFVEGQLLPRPIVKFDYRTAPEDQPIGEDYLLAIGYPVAEAKDVAYRVNESLQTWLREFDLQDFCLILGFDSQGELTISSEISPDCMRLKGENAAGAIVDYDKDLFRAGASVDLIIQRWSTLMEALV